MINYKIRYACIVPCYNTPKEWISRLLSSLVRQHVDNNDLRVILVDDCSPEKDHLDLAVAEFGDKLHLEIINTINSKHTPGYTRQAGLDYLASQNFEGVDWLFFIDHDDFLEDDILPQVSDKIREYNEPYAVCCNMRSWNPEKDKFVDFKAKQAWLHGKFYNIRHLIKPYGIHFYTDIHTHEDIGFNCQCQAVMYEVNHDFLYLDIFAYRWVEEPTSISRREDYEGGKRGYLHDYFNDYITSASEPFFELAKTGNWWFVNQVFMTLLHCYFYYMGAIFREGEEGYRDNYQDTYNLYRRIRTALEFSPQEIIDFVKSDSPKYQVVRNDCMMHEGAFVEKTSFEDFIKELEFKLQQEESYENTGLVEYIAE